MAILAITDVNQKRLFHCFPGICGQAGIRSREKPWQGNLGQLRMQVSLKRTSLTCVEAGKRMGESGEKEDKLAG